MWDLASHLPHLNTSAKIKPKKYNSANYGQSSVYEFPRTANPLKYYLNALFPVSP